MSVVLGFQGNKPFGFENQPSTFWPRIAVMIKLKLHFIKKSLAMKEIMVYKANS